MRKQTAVKRQWGYGEFVEVPSAIYMQGVLLDLVDPESAHFYYVLPNGEVDVGRNYVRATIHGEGGFMPVPLTVWNSHEETKQVIEAPARHISFSRGLVTVKYASTAIARATTLSDGRRTQLFLMYLEWLDRSVRLARDWHTTMKDYALNNQMDERDQWMVTTASETIFDLMYARHREGIPAYEVPL
jgi:hypothetical protein